MKNTERFTVYMTEGERLALRLLGRHLGLSENAVIKVLIRERSGLAVSPEVQELLSHLVDSPVLFGQDSPVNPKIHR